MAAVSSFSDAPIRNIAHPFIIAPTCKREDAAEQKILLSAARDAVESKASHIGGRRQAALRIAFIQLLDRDGLLLKKLGDLPLFGYHCGHNEITMDIYFKHLFKRFRNLLIRLLCSTIDGVVLTRQLLKTHLLRDTRYDSQHIDRLLNPDDRQDLKSMYDLLSEIAILPGALELDTPAFRNTRRVLRLVGSLYQHVLDSYTNIKLSLHERLTHLSAAMHLMMALYQREAGGFVPSQPISTSLPLAKTCSFASRRLKSMIPLGNSG